MKVEGEEDRGAQLRNAEFRDQPGSSYSIDDKEISGNRIEY